MVNIHIKIYISNNNFSLSKIVNSSGSLLVNNSSIWFKNTSIDLFDQLNLYLLGNIKSISVSLENQDEFTFYLLNKQEYQITVEGVNTGSGTIDFQNFSFNLSGGETNQDIILLIQDSLEATGLYQDLQIDDNKITFKNNRYGSNPEGEFTDDDFQALGNTYLINILDNAELIQETKSEDVSLDKLQRFVSGNEKCYKLNILFKPTDNTVNKKEIQKISSSKYLISTNLSIQVNYQKENSTEILSKAFQYKLNAYFHLPQENLIVLLNNLKKSIENDLYDALFQSDYREPLPDHILLNDKRKEYLLEIFDLTVGIGNYKSLISALRFFGYGELLAIKEFWKSRYDGSYKKTDITSQVLTEIDRSLSGYRKTNQLGLTFQINTLKRDEDGDLVVDENNLPLYQNILYDVENYLIKFYSLKRYLEKYFLPLNSKIVEIEGEYSSILSAELIVFLSSGQVRSYLLNENIKFDLGEKFSLTEIPISNHRVEVEPWALEEDLATPEEDLKFFQSAIDQQSSNFNQDYFWVIRKVEELVPDQDLELLTGFISQDFGLLEISLNPEIVLTDYFQDFYFLIYDQSGNKLFQSEYRDTSLIENNQILIGIKNVGSIKVQVILRDFYGGITTIGSQGLIEIYDQPLNIITGKSGGIDSQRGLGLVSTFPTDSPDIGEDHVVIETIDEGNTHQSPRPNLRWDYLTGINIDNTTQQLIEGYNESDYDALSTRKTVNQLKGIPLDKMSGVSLNSTGYQYNTFLIDLIGDNSYGNRKLRLKYYQHQELEEYTFLYSSSFPDNISFIKSVITFLNNLGEESYYSWFTYTLNFHSVDGTIGNTIPMIRMTQKEPGFPIENIFLEVANPYTPFFQSGYIANTYHLWLPQDAVLPLDFTSSVSGELKIIYNQVEYTVPSFTPVTVQDLIDRIENVKVDNQLDISIFHPGGDLLLISSRKSLILEHPSVGKNQDCVRGVNGSGIEFIRTGSDVKLGQPVYAFINEKSKQENRDIVWTLSDSITKEIISIQKSYAFRWVFLSQGGYDLRIDTVDDYGTQNRIRNGCFLVR